MYSSSGWTRYRIDAGMQGPVVLSLSLQEQQYRLCINMACNLPSQVNGVCWRTVLS